MKKGMRDSVLGSVFFAGLALLLFATAYLTGLSWGERQMLTVEFENARGLRVGEPVFLLGIQLGKVTKVAVLSKQIDQDKLTFVTRVELQIDSEAELKSDTVIKIVDASMLGGKRVEITPGAAGTPVKMKDHIFHGKAALGPLEALGELIGGEKNRVNLEAVLQGVRDFVDDLNDSEGSLSRLIKDDTLIKEAERFLTSIRKSAEELEKKQSLLGRLIYDDELGRKAEEIISNLEKVTEKLNSTEGALGKFLNDEAFAAKFDKIIDDIAKATTSLAGKESTIGRLFNDVEWAKKIDNIIANVEKTTDSLNDKDSGLLGALIHDEAMLEDGRKIIRDLSEISDKINSGQGALARLINDEDMGRRLDSMIRQITRAIEDAREAAPVGTFFQVFSSAF